MLFKGFFFCNPMLSLLKNIFASPLFKITATKAQKNEVAPGIIIEGEYLSVIVSLWEKRIKYV
jgi:hypothetical protein